MQITDSFDSQLLTFRIGEQYFGLSALHLNDILGPQKITHIPLSLKSVAGVMNLRGRIVTSIDIAHFLSLKRSDCEGMNIVVEDNNDLFSFNVDAVGEVLNISKEHFEPVPGNLALKWGGIAKGVYKLSDKLLIILSISDILERLKSKRGVNNEILPDR